jgi:hypothetical protein
VYTDPARSHAGYWWGGEPVGLLEAIPYHVSWFTDVGDCIERWPEHRRHDVAWPTDYFKSRFADLLYTV